MVELNMTSSWFTASLLLVLAGFNLLQASQSCRHKGWQISAVRMEAT